jgi:hypothetical protein
MVTVLHPYCYLHISNPKFYRLCNVRFTTVRVNIDLDKVKINTRNGDFNASSLAQVVNTDTFNNVVVRTWIDRAGKLVNYFPPTILISLF